MKKLAIMFVMLLGSVATMQAQSFDFSCLSTETTLFGQAHIPDGFSEAQADILFALEFESHPDFPDFHHPTNIGVDLDQTILFGISHYLNDGSAVYEVYDEHGSETFDFLQNATYEEAIAHVVTLLGIDYNDIRGIRLSNGGVDIATSFANPYEAPIGTSIDFDIRAWTELASGILPLDVVFSLAPLGNSRYNENVSIDGNIVTVNFVDNALSIVRVYASSELTGQTGTDRVFLTEQFRGTN